MAISEQTLVRIIKSDLLRAKERRVLRFVAEWCDEHDNSDSNKRKKGNSFQKFEDYIRYVFLLFGVFAISFVYCSMVPDFRAGCNIQYSIGGSMLM